MYIVFVRNWWRHSTGPHSWQGLEANPTARKTRIGRASTEEEARAICERYNTTHKPGKLSRKAEYTEARNL
jgi:hypothetical protein